MDDFFRDSLHELDDGKPKKKTSKDEDREERSRKCPSCHHVHSLQPNCPSCGHEYPRQRRVHEVGDLAEFGAAQANIFDTKQQFYSELLWIANARGYKKGWAAYKFKARHKEWPDGLSDEMHPPSETTLNWVKYMQIRRAKSRKKRGYKTA